MEDRQARILTLDIETLWNLVGSWDTYSKGNWSAVHTFIEWFPLGVGVKWFHEEPQYFALEDYKGYKPPIKMYRNGDILFRNPNIKPLLKDVWECLDRADIIITWNGKRFDIKKLNSKFVKHGFPEFSPFFHIDVMKEKTKIMASNSNSLDATGEEWGTARKQAHEGKGLWLKVATGEKPAQKEMANYCMQDLVVTELNYERLRGWIRNHPPMNVIMKRPEACPTCGRIGTMNPRESWRFTTAKQYRYYRCKIKSCGAVVKSRVPEDSYQKMQYVN